MLTIERLLHGYEIGISTRDEFWQDLLELVSVVESHGDAAAALEAAAELPDLSAPELARLVALADSRTRRTLDESARGRLQVLADDLAARARRQCAVSTPSDAGEALAALPTGRADAVLVVETMGRVRGESDPAAEARLVPALVGAVGAALAVDVVQQGRADVPDAVLAAVVRADGVPRHVRTTLAKRIDPARLSRDELVPTAALLSVHGADGQAARLAQAALPLLEPADPDLATLALVLFLAGRRDEAATAASRFVDRMAELRAADSPAAGHGWWTQAREGLATMLLAWHATPQAAAAVLAARPVEMHRRNRAGVGAMVPRLAHLSMRAHLATGDVAEARRQAAAAVATTAYRRYELHLQASDLEFDVRLTDRLALSPDELHHARAVATPDPTPVMLSEGIVYFEL